jgi:proteasome accessory factor B
LNAVNRAIRKSLELALRYTALADEAPKRIVVHPRALVLYEGAVYIAGYRAASGRGDADRASSGIRFFKLDRVTDARVTSRSFVPRPEAVDDLLADSITLFRSPEPPRKYRIRIDAPRARWACEKPFHPGQRVRPQADGGVVLEIDRAWDAEMLPQLLSLGEHVEVLEPADVREQLAEAATRIAARHAAPARRARSVAHAK